MALSFEESKKQLSQQAATPMMAEMPMMMSLENDDIMVAAETWTRDTTGRYVWFDDYKDENISYIDENKSIIVDSSQVNISQETNSQFIPFEMSRKYDNIDLADMAISIHYTTSDDNHYASTPVNVEYTDDKIRFVWLVDSNATRVPGTIQFEIHADGAIYDSNNKAYGYRWKSKSTDKFNIIKSLCYDNCDDIIKVDDSWVQDIVDSVASSVVERIADIQLGSEVAEAKQASKDAINAANDAQAAASAANSAASQAGQSAIDASSAASQAAQDAVEIAGAELKADISNTVQSMIDNANHATITYVDDEISKVQGQIPTVPTNISAFTNDVGYATNDALQGVAANIPTKLSELENDASLTTETYVQDYVTAKISEINIEDQLGDYAKIEDISTIVNESDLSEHQSIKDLATKQDVTDAIAAADLDNYYKKEETYSQGEVNELLKTVTVDLSDYYTKEEIDTALSDVDVDLSDYYTKTEVDTNINNIKTATETATSNVSSLSKTVTDLQTTVNGIDTSPRLTYDVKYNDTDDVDVGENVFAFYEITNEGQENESREIKQKFTIVGGSGGASTSSSLKIGYVTTSPLVITVNDEAIIKFTFSGTDSSGDIITEGNATWKVDGKIVATDTVVAGENSFNATDYILVGSHKVNLTVIDDAGSLVSKNWTVQKIDVRIESSFNDKLTYPINPVSFDYTPYGAISKDVHFVLDGKEIGKVTTSASGIPTAYDIPAQKHGAHLLESYITTVVNGNDIESNHVVKDIIWYDPNSNIPVIGCTQQKFTARQYDATNITYTVYDPSTETPTVVLKSTYVNENGELVTEFESELTLTSSTNVWQYKTDVIGNHTLTITCGNTVKTLKATVVKLDINVAPVTAGLAFDFNPTGKSNNDADRLWSYGDGDSKVLMTVSDNFDWVNGGYQIDDKGDQYFCIKAGTFAEINYKLFADDAKVNGKEFKVVFKTTNIKKRDTTFLSCMNNDIGVDMRVENARIYSSNNNLYSPYCEEDIIEFEFNINKSTDIPMVLTYEDGVGNRPMIYTSDASFWQTTPQPITIGSDDCDVHIYRMKAYSRSLSDSDILSNFIADARNADEMIKRYDRNQIYDENNLLSPETLAEKCPELRVIMVDAPWFTNDKDNKVDDTIIRMIYKNGDSVLDNWTCNGARHSGQGTSSNEYGYAGRNIDLIMDGDAALFTLGDGTTSKTITLTRDSVPTDYLNVKVNIASSENQNNAQMARRYNTYNPFVRSAKFNDNKVKDCMEFYNCVIFVKERDEDISTHREFLDNNWHFYAIGNVGDSKKTDDTRVNDKNDPKECVVEITDFNVPLAEFPTGNGNDICSPEDWKAGNIAYDYLYAPYKYKEGKFKSFGSESYEFRYEMKGITEEQREANINAWRDMYKFVVTSTDEEFYSRLKEYFVIDSALYYYLFTERYTMVDNRAKNSFWHYGKVYITTAEAATLGDKTGGFVIDDVQAAINDGYRWDLSFGYDFDTSLGIDNTGKLVLTYGKEDTDYYVDGDPSSSYIYRAATSTFFCRLRDLFKSEMQGMFVNREDANAWSATGLINQWDKAQEEFPEELWRLDIQRKYLRTYKGISIDNSIAGEANPRFLVEMMNGRKKYQRRMFERNQELYMATKYFGKTATQDQIMMRFNNPETYVVKPDFTLYITPYSDMYIGVKFGNVEAVNFRAKAGVEYTVPYSIAADTADITLIYGASFIQAIGDLSKCYVGDNDFSKASRLKSLTIGSNISGYENTYMKKISLGNNKLLEYLDIRNITGLSEVVDLSQCGNMLVLHAEGSGATGVIFANGGKIQKFYIPAITSLTMKNLNYIQEFSIADYNNLKSLVVENTSAIDTYEVIGLSPVLNTLRLVGLNWNIDNTDTFDRVLSMRGINNDGGEIAQSVLTGHAHVSIIREQQLYDYQKTWPDLEITFNTMIEQYAVIFKNDDGTVLEVQYVDKGEDATDPVATGRIPTPTKESSVSTDFTYAGWDVSLEDIFSERVITAIYTGTTRRYTVKYVSKGITLQESTGLYGDYIEYTGTLPTYTLEESGYKYYLFKDWDKSGYIDGNKTINATFDIFEFNKDTSYVDKELADLSNVEIYALSKLGVENTLMSLEDGDPYSIRVGYDIDYDDIESELIVAEKTSFDGTGTNYIDTGIDLFRKDRDFTFAIDYEFLSGTAADSVIAQCFKSNGSSGFKLWYNNGVKFNWCTTASTTTPGYVGYRDMMVIRHKAGESTLNIYMSNLNVSTSISIDTLDTTKNTLIDSTLVLGCAKADDGEYDSHAIGNVHWCKVWYKDLGDSVCRKLANWTHENIRFEMCGQKRFYLTSDSNKRCTFSLLASHLLERRRTWGSTGYSTGGWANSALNKFLNTRLYNAMPTQTKALLKQVTVQSSIGDGSKDISTSECYITIPSIIELNNSSSYNIEPYISEMAIASGKTISYMTSNTNRQRAYDGEDYAQYWTRSPNASYSRYVYSIDSGGYPDGYEYPSYSYGVLIEISF